MNLGEKKQFQVALWLHSGASRLPKYNREDRIMKYAAIHLPGIIPYSGQDKPLCGIAFKIILLKTVNNQFKMIDNMKVTI
jgi:hypothetical protein